MILKRIGEMIRESPARRLPSISIVSKVADMLSALADIIRGGCKAGTKAE
ncbi:MAG: hypothetical protein QXH00_10310 [Candidatus Jordarchaeales archaeon]